MIKRHGIFSVLIMLVALCSSSVAIAGSCDDENNDAIDPTFALCSTHVYNVLPNNHTVHNLANISERQIMDDVIALKTTVITQQMKQQYDYLNSTIKRLKNQLQKAVLTTSLEAAGASSDSGSSYRSNDRNISLAGAQNCNNQRTTSDVLTCLYNNYNLIYNMSNGGRNPTSDLRQQLATDCEIASNVSVTGIVSNIKDVCKKRTTITNATVFEECLGKLNSEIRNKSEELQRQNSQTNALQSLFGNR